MRGTEVPDKNERVSWRACVLSLFSSSRQQSISSRFSWLSCFVPMSLILSLSLSFLLAPLSFAAPTLPERPTASNVYGKHITYRGLYTNEVEGFIGIRYAHDTGGENRFRPPRPYEPSKGSTIDVTTPGPSCPQRVSHGAPSVWNVYDYVNHICVLFRW